MDQGGGAGSGVRGKYSQSARVAEEGSGGSAGIPCTMCGTPRSGRLAALQHAELCFIVVEEIQRGDDGTACLMPVSLIRFY